MQIAGDAFLDLSQAPRHLGLGEVAIPVVHGLELRSVNGNARHRQKTDPAAQLDETSANLGDRGAVVLAEVGNGLVVGNQSVHQPHHLDIPPRLALKTAARLDLIEITVNVKLQQNRRVIAGPSGRGRASPLNIFRP